MSFAEHPADGVALLLWAAGPHAPQQLATPFFHAAAAAAMDVPVEVYFSADSVRLLLPGVAASLRASELIDSTIYDAMRQAHAHGARFLVCTDALHARGLSPKDLIAECSGHGGAVQFMARTLDTRWRTLVF